MKSKIDKSIASLAKRIATAAYNGVHSISGTRFNDARVSANGQYVELRNAYTGEWSAMPHMSELRDCNGCLLEASAY